MTRPVEELGWVLLVPGYLASMDWGCLPEIERGLLQSGWACVALTLSGSGHDARGRLTDRSGFSRNTYAQELEDLEFARDRIAGPLGLLPERGVVLGHSRGAAMGLLHAAEDGRYRALIGISAGDHVARYRAERLAAWRRDGSLPIDLPNGEAWSLALDALEDFTRNSERYDLARAAATWERPALLIHGARDQAVSAEEARRHADRFRLGRWVELAEVGHNLRSRGDTEGQGLSRAVAEIQGFLGALAADGRAQRWL